MDGCTVGGSEVSSGVVGSGVGGSAVGIGVISTIVWFKESDVVSVISLPLELYPPGSAAVLT